MTEMAANTDSTQLDNILLAMLFASEEPLSTRRVSALLPDVPLAEIKESITKLESRLAEEYPSVMLEKVAGGYQLATNPAYAEYVARLYRGKRKQRLSKAGMETLAIIAYKQPITRADIEHIRGVGCGGVITTLMERSLIRISGKAKVLGAPFLYATTPEFLEYLGLGSLKDLPSMEELEALLEREESVQESEGGGEAPSDAESEEAPDETEED